MKILNWDKPKKVMSSEKYKNSYTSDCGVPGTYVPNMDAKDKATWKAKVVGKTIVPQIEIRKDTFVIVVSLGEGYKYKHYTRDRTKGINVHIASAGPIQLTFKQFEEMKQAIEEAREYLLYEF